jgi:hypothetical protein
MSALVINSTESLQRVIGELREAFGKHKFLRLNLKTGKDRSLDQNALSHAWYQQLAREMPQHDALGWKCECKLLHGVPILRAEDGEFRTFYDAAIKKSLSYEEKLAAMRFVPVTSLMTSVQLSKYLEAMQHHFAKQGVVLEFPEA